jgi:hypothetical protein
MQAIIERCCGLDVHQETVVGRLLVKTAAIGILRDNFGLVFSGIILVPRRHADVLSRPNSAGRFVVVSGNSRIRH